MMGARQYMREGFRRALLGAAKYNVEFEGEFPKSTPTEPYMVAMYPHNEHANSLLIPQRENLTYMAAHDHFFKNPLQLLTIMAWLTAATIPVVRDKKDQTPSRTKKMYADIKKAFGRSQKVAIYPQGTRSGTYLSPELLAEPLMRNIGAAKISNHFQAPVIPIGILYPFDYQPIKDGPSGGRRIKQRLSREPVEPVTIKVLVGDPIPPLADRKHAEQYMSGLAFILWGMVHGGSQIARLPVVEDDDFSYLSEFDLSSR